MLKRIWFFLLTNILVIVVISIVLTIISSVFGINLWWYYDGSTSSILSVAIYAAVVWFTWAFISLFLSKWMAKKMQWVVVYTKDDLSNLWDKENKIFNLIQDISNKNGIKMPEFGIYESPEPNAFATWATKNSSLVAVSTWLIEVMNQDEIDWVIAHEMAHILNWDMVTMTLLQWVINTFVVFLSRIIASLADQFFSNSEEPSEWPSWVYYVVSIVLDLLFTVLASIVTMWYSRIREFKADEWSAKFVWKEKMIIALQKLKTLHENMTTWDSDALATMKISSKERTWILSLFASHPDLDKRIENLKNFNI